MNKTIASVISLLLLLIVSGCNKTSQEVRLPGIDLEPDQINTAFKAFEDPVGDSANTHKNNEILSITLRNSTNTSIVFSPDYVKIFAKSNGEWIMVDHAPTYPRIEETLPTTKDFPPGMVVVVLPTVKNMTTDTVIRIYVIGQRSDTAETVGAYIELTLHP